MRFVKEYANYENERIKNFNIGDGAKAKAYEAINKAVHMYERGIITGTEAVRMIGASTLKLT